MRRPDEHPTRHFANDDKHDVSDDNSLANDICDGDQRWITIYSKT